MGGQARRRRRVATIQRPEHRGPGGGHGFGRALSTGEECGARGKRPSFPPSSAAVTYGSRRAHGLALYLWGSDGEDFPSDAT